ncbi:MAG TPA: hypothetical protein PKA00_01300 [Saprospiraceae bacterium]|nr:hypothetical protein [Saprospiraceae bacterium]HMQ81504.1 hypothetical protein [Saprospiraceae bacterium]
MKRFYIPITVVTIFLLAIWLHFRNQIWTNVNLYPDECLMIYMRDGSAFHAVLRFFFVAMWGWAAFLLWTSGKSLYMWVAALTFSSFLLLDNLILGQQYLQYQLAYDHWEAYLPVGAFRGIPEAIFTIFGNLLVSTYLKKSRLKRLDFESKTLALT